MGLHIDASNVSAFDTVERFTGTTEEMEQRLSHAYLYYSNWRWSDESHTAIERMHPTTHLLGFYAMSTGVPEVTAKNYREVFVRLNMIESVYGTTLPITLEEVKAHIGLRCNVREKTKKQFDADMAGALREKAQAELNRLTRQEAA